MQGIEEQRKNLKVGDWVRVDGYGKRRELAYSFSGLSKYPVLNLFEDDAIVDWFEGNGRQIPVTIRRSSIIEVIPAEPKPKVGEWRSHCEQPGEHDTTECGRRVYRSTGWSKDERKAQRRTAQINPLAGQWVRCEGVLSAQLVPGYTGWFNVYSPKIERVERRKADRRKS